MATAVAEPPYTPMNLANPKPLRVCFSYAAYAKNLIHYLTSSNIPVDPGLSDAEFSAVESAFGFTFPPDLRSILQEGLPVGPGFPNWRSSSKQQLEILANLPILGICKEVSKNELWFDSWGDRPEDADGAARLAGILLKEAPILVPIYRRFYISSAPCVAGNPVFYVHGGDVRLWSFDVSGFFQQIEFRMSGGGAGGGEVSRRQTLSSLFAAPAWAATEARRIEFWTEMAERGGSEAARGWWSGELGGCLEEVCWRLRDGGWKEKDVREMMMMDGCDYNKIDRVDNNKGTAEPRDIDCVERRVKALSSRLLRAGWSTEDVVESLGSPEDFHHNCIIDGDFCFDFRITPTSDAQNSLSFFTH
ncbi:hypothetical protein ABFS83_08G062100 [Erythranthe nasuta]